jgi:broad specificity phosphatase PhoE
MLTRLFLCRHGEPDETVRGQICGALDVGLSPRGVEQANLLAVALAPEPLVAVYSSPQRRALDTARPIAAEHDGAVLEHAGLREIDFGAFEGLSHDEAAARYPDLYRSWLEQPARVRFPGGECCADVRARAVGALGEILGRHEGRSLAVVAHGGVIRALLADCLRMSPEAMFRLDQRYGGVNVVDWLDGIPVVRLLNADQAMLAVGRGSSPRLYSSA